MILSSDVFEKTKENREGEDKFDLLTFFLNSTGEDEEIANKKLKSDKFLRDAMCSVMIAGRDSMGSCLCLFFWIVATHPYVETKILEEIKSNLSEIKDRKNSNELLFTPQELQNKSTYLHAALYETLRLYPSVPINSYTAIKSDIIPTGHRFGPETRILIPYYSMGRMESIWGDNSLEFKPEKFISEQTGSLKHFPCYKFPTFNLGSKACVGKDTSFIQMKMVVIAVLKNFKIKVVEGTNVLPSNSFILHMRSSLKVKIAKRSES